MSRITVATTTPAPITTAAALGRDTTAPNTASSAGCPGSLCTSRHVPPTSDRRTAHRSNTIVANGGSAAARPTNVAPRPHRPLTATSAVTATYAKNTTPCANPNTLTATSVDFVTYFSTMPHSNSAHVTASAVATHRNTARGVIHPDYRMDSATTDPTTMTQPARRTP